MTPSYVRYIDEPPARPKIIIDTSRGDAAIFDPYAVGLARQLRQRKVFSKVRGPKRAMIETGRNKRRKGPRTTGRRQGMAPAKIQGQRKVILAPV